jgi:hypothetical protein
LFTVKAVSLTEKGHCGRGITDKDSVLDVLITWQVEVMEMMTRNAIAGTVNSVANPRIENKMSFWH